MTTLRDCRPPDGTPDGTVWASPAWCAYPEASRPVSGCWSLLGGRISKPQDCGDCECNMHTAAIAEPPHE